MINVCYLVILYLSLILNIFVIHEIYGSDESDIKVLPNIFNIGNNDKLNNIDIINYPKSNLTNLTDNDKDSIYPDIAALGNDVYVIYQEFVTSETGNEKEQGNNYDIFFIKSEDNGKTFNKPVNLSNTTEFSERPQIAASENGIYVVWVDELSSNNKEIFFTKSVDNGKTFDEKINLSNNPTISNYPEISIYDENVYVVWRDTENPDIKNSTIMFKNSVDNGNTFNEIFEITQDIYNSYPKINSYEENVYVVWNNDGQNVKYPKNDINKNKYNNSKIGMFFIQSFDRGFNFQPIKKLDTEPFGESQISIDKNKVLIVWSGTYSNSLQNIYFVASNDSGRTFTNTMTVFSDYPSTPKSNFNIADSSNKIYSIIKNPINIDVPSYNFSYLVWQNIFSEQDNDIIFMYSNSDDKVVKILNLSNNNVISECPSIAISNDMIYFVWEDFLDKEIHDIMFANLST